MKTNTKKIALAILASSTIAILGISSSFAYGGGNGNGQGRGHGGQGQYQGKGNGQGQGRGQNQTKQGGHFGKSGNLINNVAKQDLSEVEKINLINQYGEEKMARDLYKYAYDKYGVQTFINISNSEAKHMEAVKVLLDRYEIDAPSDYAADNELYEILKKEADLGKKEAIEMGVKIEKVDIDNIVKTIKDTDNDDIKIVFTNIGGASYNHMRGFVKALEQNGFTTNIDYSAYLSADEVNVRGPLKYKLAEKLETEGVKLPTQVSSENMKKHKKGHGHGHGKKHHKNNKYKSKIKKVFSEKIKSMSEEKLKNILTKIETLKTTIRNSSDYSSSIKKRYLTILEALREIIEEKLFSDEDFIGDLLK